MTSMHESNEGKFFLFFFLDLLHELYKYLIKADDTKKRKER